MKKGDTTYMNATILALVFVVIFAVFAVGYYTGTFQKAGQLVNAKVQSKFGTETIKLPSLGKIDLAKKQGLEAKITLIPNPPFCQFERIEVSAFDSTLPEGVSFSDVICTWDFDVAKDAVCDEQNSVQNCGNNVPGDDVEGQGCALVVADFANAEQREMKLTFKITGDVPGSGTTDTATAAYSTTMQCACDLDPEKESLRACTRTLGIRNNKVKSDSTVLLTLPNNVDVKGVHIRINSGKELVKDLRLDVGNDGLSDYVLKGNFTGEFMIDGSQLVSGRSLAKRVNSYVATCPSFCQVPIKWYADKEVNITDANVPYQIK